MHIPDGILTPAVSAGTITTVLFYLGLSWKRIKEAAAQIQIPKIALLAAFVFVAQMINIPVSGGTSGHLVGATLVMLLAGPFNGVLIMTMVITIQMLIFQDGGLTAWGANVLNLGIAAVWTSYFVYSLFSRLSKTPRWTKFNRIILFVSAWVSVEVSALFCSAELSLSHLAPLAVLTGLMSGVHALIGVLEGLLTLLIVETILSWRQDILYSESLKL